MVWLGYKNYFKNFKYFFIPLGALFLGIVVGSSIMIPMIWGAVKTFVTGVAKTLGDYAYDWDAVGDTLIAALKKLDWANPQNILNEVSTSDYWSSLLRECASAACGDTSAAEEQMRALTDQAMGTIAGGMAIFGFFTCVGGFVGYFMTRSLIRSGMAKRSVLQSILATIINTIINVTVLAAGTILIMKSKQYAVLSVILVVLVYGAVAFLEAYFVHGLGKVSFFKVMNIKNFFLLALLNTTEVALFMGIFTLLKTYTNIVIAICVGFSAAIITIISAQLNAEAYVKDLVEHHRSPVQEGNSDTVAEQAHAPAASTDQEEVTPSDDVATAEISADNAPKD